MKVCPTCQVNGFTEVIRSQSEKFGFIPVKVVYHCEVGCKPTRDAREHNDSSPEKRSYFEKHDIGKVREIELRLGSQEGRAVYEKGGLNLANLTDEQQIEAEDNYRICVRRGGEQESKPKKRQRKMLQDEDE